MAWLRGLLLGVCLGLALFVVSALFGGPLLGGGIAVVVWLAVAAVAGVAVARSLRLADGARGTKAASLLVAVSPELASRARSAAELSLSAATGQTDASADLIAAHRDRVRRDLAEVPLGRATPWRWLGTRVVFGSGALALLAALVMLGAPRARAGAFALLHPFAAGEAGERVVDIVEETAAELHFPAYQGRSPGSMRVNDLANLEVPSGTLVRYTVVFRVPVNAPRLDAAGESVRLQPVSDAATGRAYTAELVAHQSGPLRIHAERRDSDEAMRDARSRYIRSIPDAAPTVSLQVVPGGEARDVTVELDAPTTLAYAASDDYGIASLALNITRPDGRQESRPLERVDGLEGAMRNPSGTTTVLPLDLGARAGDIITLTVSAEDTDDLDGPHAAVSEPLVLRIASEASRRAEAMAGLAEVVELALHTLADRLELPLDAAQQTPRARHERLQPGAERLVLALRGLAAAAPELSAEARRWAREIERGMSREARTRDGASASWQRSDDALIEIHEDVALGLADRLTRARLDDAAAIARELESLRREMTSLLAELRRADSAEARAALRAALMRAQQRMSELNARLASMAETVPGEFLNRNALPEQEQTQDALAAMQEALTSGDVDAMERALMDLERQIDQMASALGGAADSFAESSFGAEQQAMAEALDALRGVEVEERQLVERTEAVRRSAADRALGEMDGSEGGTARRLADAAEAAQEGLRGIATGAIGTRDEESVARLRQRLQDVRDALGAGDFGEARRMSAEARRESLRLSRDLDLSALMFPGAGGRTARAAERAGRVAREVAQLGRDIDRAMPSLRDHMTRPEADQVARDAQRQQEVSDATQRVAEQFAEGPDGAPLDENAASALDQIRDRMTQARRALEQGDPLEAGGHQEEAARQLTELREQLEQQQQSGGGGGGSANQRSESQRVEIPSSSPSSNAFRRRVLDAMGEGAPEGYEDAVRRYYERLLR